MYTALVQWIHGRHMLEINAVLSQQVVMATHRTPHIPHANAIDMLQKSYTYTLYMASLKFA